MQEYKSKRPEYDFLSKKLFVDYRNKKLKPKEFDYIYDLIFSSSTISGLFPDANKSSVSITFLDSNLAYEIYSLEYAGDIYIFKFNYRVSEISLLKKEFDILSSISNLDMSPSPIHYEVINNREILLISFINSVSINHFTFSEFMQESFSVGKSLGKLNYNTNSNTDEFSDFVNFYKTLADFESNLGSEIFNNIKKDFNFSRSLQNISTLFSKFEEEYLLLPKSGKISLCHGNLQLNNVIKIDNEIKLINFHSAFNLDPFCDLAISSLNFNYAKFPDEQKNFISGYIDSFNDFSLNEIISIMPQYRMVFYKIILIKILCLFFYEIILNGYSRKSKFINIIKTYERIRPLVLSDGLIDHIQLENSLYIF